jgi:HSP20 family protein
MRNLAVTPFLGIDRDFGRMLDRFLTDESRSRLETEGWRAPLDLFETQEAIVVELEVPGVDPAELEISVQGDVLTLAGEKHAVERKEEGRVTYTERVQGSFRRQIQLPSEVEADQAEATHAHGVVTIRLPKTVAVRPRRIEVKAK